MLNFIRNHICKRLRLFRFCIFCIIVILGFIHSSMLIVGHYFLPPTAPLFCCAPPAIPGPDLKYKPLKQLATLVSLYFKVGQIFPFYAQEQVREIKPQRDQSMGHTIL